jgi:hypothetical protein
MANKYRPNDRVVIRDGNVTVTLIDDQHRKHLVDVPDGTPGAVREVVFGGEVYLVRTTGRKQGQPITGTGLFAETVLTTF